MRLRTCLALIFVINTGQAQFKDTTFIFKSYNKRYKSYHSVYIEPNKKSNRYSQIAEFRFDLNSKFHFDNDTYHETLSSIIKNNRKPLPKIRINEIPLKWCSLRLYKNKYYVYYPSDWGDNYRCKFTDSTFIQYTIEGPEASLIKSFKKVENNHYTFIQKTPWSGKEITTSIYIVDARKGIAVFENLFTHSSTPMLMVSANNANEFPLIVNECFTNKVEELVFQQPNFKELTAKSKRLKDSNQQKRHD